MLGPERLPARLKWLREKTSGAESVAKFAALTGLAPSTYHSYELGKHHPPTEALTQIHLATGCSLSWLWSGEGEPFGGASAGAKAEAARVAVAIRAAKEAAGRPRTAEKAAAAGMGAEPLMSLSLVDPDSEHVYVPIISGSVAAGSPSYVAEDEIEDWAMCYAPHVPHPDRTTAVRVSGESMETLIADGGLVGVDHAVTDLGEILRAAIPMAVVRDPETEGVLVRLVKRINGDVLFHPYNRDGDFTTVVWHVDREEESPIVGKVIWSYRSY